MTIKASLSGNQPRRAFLTQIGGAACAIATGQAAIGASEAVQKVAPVGCNIYGWSQYYQREAKNVNEHLDDVFEALRDAGYDYLEGFVDVAQPENNLRLAQRMRGKGLAPVCLYTGGQLHSTDWQKTVDKLLAAATVCQKAGFTLIDCNADPIGREKTDDELKTQARALNALGAGLRAMDMKLGVHNHTPEMANGAREFHHNLKETDPATVGLCYDVHWVYRGGIAPADSLKEYGSRIVSWHLRQSRGGTWWEDLDSGDIDYAAIARFAKEHALIAPYTVELALEKGTEVTRSAVENHRRSREFVRRTFGV
jgi:sugar phosphate isomerase/epimerase